MEVQKRDKDKAVAGYKGKIKGWGGDEKVQKSMLVQIHMHQRCMQ